MTLVIINIILFLYNINNYKKLDYKQKCVDMLNLIFISKHFCFLFKHDNNNKKIKYTQYQRNQIFN